METEASSIKKHLSNLPIALIFCAVGGLVGCSSAPAGPSAADLQSYNKQRKIDPSKVNQFLDQLAATPAPDRRAFVNQHADDMRALTESQDPAVQSRFHQIVGIK
jgi:type IV pilus biogenesis protein CpaD/CtpE